MENKNIIVNELQNLGLSEKESKVYYELLKIPYSNGSQIAKRLGYPRTSIYSTLSKLINNSCILSIPKGDVTTYKAIDPGVLMKRLKNNMEKASNLLEEEFKKMDLKPKENQFLNIESSIGMNEKIRGILKNAKKEVYINTNFDIEALMEFKDIFDELKEKSVRVIFFYFDDKGYDIFKGEHYKRSALKNAKQDKMKRILMVADMEVAFMASDYGGKFYGTYSKNKLLINIIAEHIHNDIYMMKLKKDYNGNFWEDVKLNTMQELENRL